MGLKADVVIIDPQNDFCDPKGSLFVSGADKDMERLAVMLKRVGDRLNEVHVTLDSHHRVSVFHPLYWKNSAGVHPNPFTMISTKDVESGAWTPIGPSLFKRSLQYVRDLEKGARYPLVIWPEHCLIGSPGHNIFPVLYDAIAELEIKYKFHIEYVVKGSNIHCEAYSVIKAEVPDPQDTSTQVNTDFIQNLMNADMIGLAGEASSHCLFNSLKDIVTEFKDPSQTKKIKLLTDCTSPVTGFEAQHQELLAFCSANGIEQIKSTDFLS